jgi:hypothetical protein
MFKVIGFVERVLIFSLFNSLIHVHRSVNNEYVGMSRLSDDYLSTTGGVLSSIRPCLEGMAVFRNPGDNGLYAIMSHLTVYMQGVSISCVYITIYYVLLFILLAQCNNRTMR